MLFKKIARATKITFLTLSQLLCLEISGAYAGGQVNTASPVSVEACTKSGGKVTSTPEYYSMYSGKWCSTPQKDQECRRKIADSYGMSMKEYIEEIGGGGEIISYFDYETRACYE